MSTFPIATAVLAVILLAAIELWKFATRRDGSKKIIRSIPTTDAVPPQQRQQQHQQQQRGPKDPPDLYRNAYGKRVPKRSYARPAHGPEMWMAIVVTTGISAAALYIILSKQYEQDALKWAYGSLGTVVGYWLKR